jgi:tRNA(adenine34) deaminase
MFDPKTDPEFWDTAMRRAIEIAGRSHSPFGSVICRADHPESILFEGANTSAQDPTGHAEVNVLRAMASAGQVDSARDFVMVTTAEPCPMCAAACWWAEVGTIVFGTSIRSLLEAGWKQLDVPCRELFAHSRGIEPPAVFGPWRSEWTDPLYRR